MLLTGFYSSGLKAFLKAKAEAEKETKEKEEAEKQVTIEDLKGEISQMEKDYKKIQEENRALRILCEENYSGTVCVFACLRACMCMCGRGEGCMICGVDMLRGYVCMYVCITLQSLIYSLQPI